MEVSFMGYNEKIATFIAASDVKAGFPVEVSANGTVKAASGTKFCGVCISVRDGYAAVQLSGYVSVPYTGTIAVGYQKLSAASGSVSVDSSNGRELLVVDVNSSAGTAGIIL